MAVLSSCRPGWRQQTPQPMVANEGVIGLPGIWEVVQALHP